jgi:hypothetical protein
VVVWASEHAGPRGQTGRQPNVLMTGKVAAHPIYLPEVFFTPPSVFEIRARTTAFGFHHRTLVFSSLSLPLHLPPPPPTGAARTCVCCCAGARFHGRKPSCAGRRTRSSRGEPRPSCRELVRPPRRTSLGRCESSPAAPRAGARLARATPPHLRGAAGVLLPPPATV